MARPTLLLLGIVALYLGVRALVLWTAFDTVVIPNYELMPMGNLAKVLSEGWRGAPVTQYYDNCGGHLATGALAAPLFVLFGDGYLILKLVPLLLGVVDLLLIWSILHRGFGLRAAVVGALLFTLGPPTLFKYSLLAKGNHFEGLTLQLACFWAFQRMHLSQRPQRWLHALALLGGLAVTIYLGAILVLFALGITHLLIRGIRPSLGDGVRALPGLLVGLSPLAFVSLASQNRTLKLLEAKATGEGVSNPAIERLSEAVHALPVAGFYPDLGSIPGSVAGWWSTVIFVLVWGGVLLCSLRFGLMAWRTEGGTERKRYEALRLLPLVLYLPGFYYSYTFGSFQFKPYGPPVEVGQYRYFVPHFTFAALLVGATVGLLRRLGLLIGALAVAPSVFLVTLVDWSFERTGAGLAYEGYDLATYSNVTLRDVFADPDRGPRVRDWDLEHEVAWVLEFDV